MTTPNRQILPIYDRLNHGLLEFIPGDYTHNGMCTQDSLELCIAAIQNRAPTQQNMLHYTLDMAQRGWCAANGAATLANIAHYAQYVLNQRILLQWDYAITHGSEELAGDWHAIIDANAGKQPILMQVANGNALYDVETHQRNEAGARGVLKYHAICIVGKQANGYIVADPDHLQTSQRLQVYAYDMRDAHGQPVNCLRAAVPCGLLMLAMPTPKPAPPPVVVKPPPPPVIDPATRYKDALAQIQALSTQALKG